MNPEIISGLKDLKLDENIYLNVIVIAWSQWSTRIFESLIKILPKLSFVDFTIILWEKNQHFKKDFRRYENVRTYDFISQVELWKILKQTDIAITRAGATTLWELTAFGIHSIIIPLSESAGNHQEKNALYFHKNYGSDILNEKDSLDENIFRKLEKYKNLRKNWLNLKDFFKPLEIIEDVILWNWELEKKLDLEIKKEEKLNKIPEEKKDILWEINEKNELNKKVEQEEKEDISQKSNFQTFKLK